MQPYSEQTFGMQRGFIHALKKTDDKNVCIYVPGLLSNSALHIILAIAYLTLCTTLRVYCFPKNTYYLYWVVTIIEMK